VISVKTCEGLECKSCGSFIYLGSKLDTSASATPEIRRRIGMALTTFGTLNRVWRAKSMSRKTKASLYRSIVLSVMLYNAEVWPIKVQDIKALEGAHCRMMKKMMASSNKDEHFTNERLYAEFAMPTIADIITHKRLSWVGHALRRPDNDRSRQAVKAALSNKSSTWTKLVIRDCEQNEIDFGNLQRTAMNREDFRKSNRLNKLSATGKGKGEHIAR
jgi:hypothetical protein